ncbi:MAG: tryptophan-rich hypothetical protein [Motiliproteus sp.]|jgi:tryptophan-rich hypothetical protein
MNKSDMNKGTMNKADMNKAAMNKGAMKKGAMKKSAVNQINPEKLLHSKWTSVHPKDREKHFIVTALYRDTGGDEAATVLDIELQAVVTGRSEGLPWQALKQAAQWQPGWK